MFYSFPKKIEYLASQAKWRIASTNSVLLIAGLTQLRALKDFENSDLAEHLSSLLKKAKALDIPILDLNPEHMMNTMMLLGEAVSNQQQIMLAGWITPTIKQVVQHISNIATQHTPIQICIVNDAILLEQSTQHIQWVNNNVDLGLHHTNTATLNRMWSLSAPTDYVLSDKGILFAIAEQLDLEPMEIDPFKDLRLYGLDSVAMVSLIGLWRANGAQITYEDFLQNDTLEKLLMLLKYPK